MRIRITSGCLARGIGLHEGDILEADEETASDLFREGRAMPVDEAAIARLRPAGRWIDREPEEPKHFVRPAQARVDPEVGDSRHVEKLSS
jgi:hypothetical protein